MALIPFNIKKAKAGLPVVTRDGRPVRILCFDRVHKQLPIVALVMNASDTFEIIHLYQCNGQTTDLPCSADLCHLEPDMYVNVYEDGSPSPRVYKSIAAAKDAATEGTVYKLVKAE